MTTGDTIGDTKPWDASAFIRGLAARLGNNVSEDAVTALTALRNAPEDEYTDRLRSVAAEQKQKRVTDTGEFHDQAGSKLPTGVPIAFK